MTDYDIDNADAELTEDVEQEETVETAEIDHPFLSTPFSDYTVAEGLLLALVLTVIITAVIKFVKGCFSWLR